MKECRLHHLSQQLFKHLKKVNKAYQFLKKKLVTFLKKSSDSGLSVFVAQTPLQKIKNEIEAYKSSPKLDVESDDSPMQWWKSYYAVYLVLSQLGRRYLCISATSCAF